MAADVSAASMKSNNQLGAPTLERFVRHKAVKSCPTDTFERFYTSGYFVSFVYSCFSSVFRWSPINC